MWSGSTLEEGIHYAVRNPPGVSGWYIEQIDACPTCPTGWTPAIAFDSTDRAHIIFYADDAIRHAVRDEDEWSVEDIADPGPSAALDMAIDGDDDVHVGFRVGSGPVSYYRQSGGGEWIEEMPPEIDDLVALFADTDRTRWITPGPDPEIVTLEDDVETSRVSIRQPGHPEIDQIAAAVDSDGNLHFVIFEWEGGRGLLAWVRLVDDEWQRDDIMDTASNIGAVAIAMDERDRPHIAMRLSVIVLGYAHAP